MGRQRLLLKTAGAFIGIVVASLLLYGLLVSAVRRFSDQRVWNRETGGMESLEKAMGLLPKFEADCGPRRVVFGSSMSYALKSSSKEENFYNLSFPGPAPTVQTHMVERFLRASNKCGVGASSVAFEVFPILYTQQASETFANPNDLKRAYLLSWRDTDPKLLQYKLQLLTSPEIILGVLKSALRRRGGASKSESVAVYERMMGIRDLQYDPREIAALKTLLRRMKGVFPQMFLYVPPHNGELWNYSVLGQTRAEALLSELEAELGVKIHRLDRVPFAGNEFWDAIHLTIKGNERFSRLLFSAMGVARE